MSERHVNLLVGHDVYYGPPDFLSVAKIIGIETNWELGVRYYRIRLHEGTVITVRSHDIQPPY